MVQNRNQGSVTHSQIKLRNIATNPDSTGDIVRSGSDILAHSGGSVVNMSNLSTAGQIGDHSVRVQLATEYDTSHNEFDTVQWDTEVFDTDGYWSTAAPGSIIIPSGQTGKYVISASIGWLGSTLGGLRSVSIIKAGGSIARAQIPSAETVNETWLSVSAVDQLSSGTTVSLLARQTTVSGTTLTYSVFDDIPFLALVRIS